MPACSPRSGAVRARLRPPSSRSPSQHDVEQLRAELTDWALRALAEGEHEFGLYAAEFGSWRTDGSPGNFLRLVYVIWGGDEVLATHVQDSRINFAGVRALAEQEAAFEVVRKVGANRE